MNGTASRAATLLVIALVAACGQHHAPGPPTSQQQAQDTVLGYLKKTLQALPTGTVFDRARYAGSGNTPCNDEPTGVPPNEFSDIRDALFPPDTDPDAMIAKAGEIWQGWGWYVRERDGFGETEPIRLCARWVQSPNRRGSPQYESTDDHGRVAVLSRRARPRRHQSSGGPQSRLLTSGFHPDRRCTREDNHGRPPSDVHRLQE
jgi:hypothetical protein